MLFVETQGTPLMSSLEQWVSGDCAYYNHSVHDWQSGYGMLLVGLLEAHLHMGQLVS